LSRTAAASGRVVGFAWQNPVAWRWNLFFFSGLCTYMTHFLKNSLTDLCLLLLRPPA
jgi:hypothetical protein